MERMFGTLQKRLPILLRLASVTTMERANAFLHLYVKEYNAKFALAVVRQIHAVIVLAQGLRDGESHVLFILDVENFHVRVLSGSRAGKRVSRQLLLVAYGPEVMFL